MAAIVCIPPFDVFLLDEEDELELDELPLLPLFVVGCAVGSVVGLMEGAAERVGFAEGPADGAAESVGPAEGSTLG